MTVAHYTWQVATPLGNRLRTALDNLRDAQHGLIDTVRAMQQMTNTQITTLFGFPDDTTSGAAKAELASDVGNLDPAVGAPGQAIQQLLDQFA